MAEMCMCRLDLTRWGRRDSGRLESVIPGVKNGVFMFWCPQAAFPSSSFHFPPLFLLLWSQTAVGGTWSRVAVTCADIIYVYLPQDVKRETGNYVFFFLKFRILMKKLGDFTWKQLFNFVWDHKMSTTGFLNAIWLWGDVSVHVLMLKASSSHCFYNAVAWSRDI